MSGDIVASICLTEPAGGSNLFGLKTKAEKHADGWVLNGQKRYITNATRSDWYTVLARTGEKTLGLFAVHKDDSGLVLGAREKKMGIKGSPTADVTFENCRIPAHRAIGDPNQGHRYITDSLTWTRALIGGQALGIAQGAARSGGEVHVGARTVRRNAFALPNGQSQDRRYGNQGRSGARTAL